MIISCISHEIKEPIQEKFNLTRNDSDIVIEYTEDFYKWYASVINSNMTDEFNAVFIPTNSGYTTLNYEKEIANYRKYHFSEALIRRVISHYNACIDSVRKIKYSKLDTFDIDDYHELNCDFFNVFSWCQSQWPFDGIDVNGREFTSDSTSSVFITFYNNQSDTSKYYWKQHAFVSLKKKNTDWKIDNVKIVNDK